MRRYTILAAIILFLIPSLQAELYRAMTAQAAPGRLLDLIQLYKEYMPFYSEAGDQAPFWMRHSQGDKWDILFLFPMGSFEAYYTSNRQRGREEAFKKRGITAQQFAKKFYELVVWHEDVFVDGPPLDEVRRRFSGAGLFHVEIFNALAGKWDELLAQRKMENVFLRNLGRAENLIFTHEQGAAWDMFTIGFYRDLKQYAEAGDLPFEREDEAAKKAGCKSVSDIGPYLRSLISAHHDTLAVAIP